ncbi:DUF2284 domain-containing protein [bacterium]|nr:DUF2284 domain-containing protein [bacterium]
MEVRERYVARIMNDPAVFGLTEAKFIYSSQIFVNRSVRLRCQFTCDETRQSDLTPPYSPTVEETREMLGEYKYGLIVRLEEPFGQRDHLKVWSDFSGTVLHTEKECLKRGYPRAFALAIGTCLYLHHDDRFRPCEFPGKQRPTLEALGIELKDTLEMVHWGDLINRDEDDPFQLFGVLLLE